jgi:hypothetical protein
MEMSLDRLSDLKTVPKTLFQAHGHLMKCMPPMRMMQKTLFSYRMSAVVDAISPGITKAGETA